MAPCQAKGRTPCGARPRVLYALGLSGLVGRGLEQLGLVHQVDVLALEAGPLLGVLVVDGIDEAMPVLLIDKVLVGAVVEPG